MRTQIITILDKIGIYTKTDMRYLARGSFWLILERVVLILTSLALGIGLGNLINPDTYGIYKYILSIVAIISAFSLAGFTPAIIQAAARNFDGALKAGITKFLSWSIIPALISLAVSLYYFVQHNQVFGIAFLVAAFLPPLSQALSFYESVLTGKQLFGTKTFITATREIGFVASLLAVTWYTQDVLYIILTFFVYQVLTAYIAYLYTKARHIHNQEVDEGFMLFGYNLSAVSFITTMAQHFDKLFVFQLLGPAQLALYAFAILPIEKLDSFGGALSSLAIPRFSNRPLAEIQALFLHKFFIALAACMTITMSYILLAPYLFALVLPQYTEAVVYSQVLALSLLAIPSALGGALLGAHRQTKAIYITNVSEQITRITLGVVLIFLYGIWGAIIAYLTSVIVRVIITTYFALTITTSTSAS